MVAIPDTRAPLELDTYPQTPTRLAERELVRRLDAENGFVDGMGLRDLGPSVTLDALPERAITLTRGDVVAGAREDAQGVLLGWAGAGEVARGRLAEALNEAGVPQSWLPRSKSARAHAGMAIDAVSSRGLVPRAERNRPADARYTARWYVASLQNLGQRAHVVGDETGTLAVTFTLTDETLRYDAAPGYEVTAETVVEEFKRMLGEEVYKAGEVTDWLRSTLREHCAAVRFGGVWYVPKRTAAIAEALCESVSHTWGADWLLPAMPVADSGAVRQGLARGLHREISEVTRAWDETRLAAVAAGKAVGVKAAGTAFARLTELAARVKGFAAVLESEALGSIHERLRDAAERVRPLLSDSAQRGAMLDLD